MRKHLYFVVFCLALSSCSTCRQSAEDSIRAKMENEIDSFQAAMKGQLMRDSIDAARAAYLDQLIDSIAAAEYNENWSATNYKLFVNKAWPEYLDTNGRVLMVAVREEVGEIALVSVMPLSYNLQNGLKIEVGTKTFTIKSTSVTQLSRADQYGHIAINDAKGQVMYVEPEISMKVAQAIAADPGAEVTVTYYEDDRVIDLTILEEEDKLPIIASYKLLLMIKERNALDGGNVEWDD